MPSTIETGHAVNVQNAKSLIELCNVLSGYNPSNTALTIANLNTQQANSKTALDTLNSTIAVVKVPVNANEILFEPLNKLVTRIVSHLDSTAASKQIKKDARGMADDIRGFNAKRPKNVPDGDWVSQSHQSFVQRTAKFKMLIDLLSTEALYVPNEADLQIVSLTALWTSFVASVDGLAPFIAAIETARAAMYHAIYDEEIGLVDTALKAKKYSKSLTGASAVEIKAIQGIKFRKLNKKVTPL